MKRPSRFQLSTRHNRCSQQLFPRKQRQPTLGIQFSPLRQHWNFPGRYSQLISPDGQVWKKKTWHNYSLFYIKMNIKWNIKPFTVLILIWKFTVFSQVLKHFSCQWQTRWINYHYVSERLETWKDCTWKLTNTSLIFSSRKNRRVLSRG